MNVYMYTYVCVLYVYVHETHVDNYDLIIHASRNLRNTNNK